MGYNNAPRWMAGGTIAPASIVKISTAADRKVLQAGANEVAIGICQEGQKITPGLSGADTTIAATAGDEIMVYGVGDTCLLIAGSGGWTRGDLLKSDASGYGVTASGSNQNVIAYALESTAAGAKGLVYIIPNTATLTSTSALTVAGGEIFTGVITPTALSGAVDDYAPTGILTSARVRIDGGAADRNITGITAGTDGQRLRLINIGTSNSLVLKHADTGSVAANRFIGTNSADVTIRKNGAVEIEYDGTSARWRVLGA